jgi:acetyl/propionyl-CoA carboxylase alpha subunit
VARTITLRSGAHDHSVVVADDGSIHVDGGEAIDVTAGTDGTVRVGRAPVRTGWVASSGDTRWVFLDGNVCQFEVQTKERRRPRRAHHGSASAPMPATVLRIVAQPGAVVKRGDTLIILEAMKMELPIRADADGTVLAVRCREGELVQPGTILIDMDETDEAEL